MELTFDQKVKVIDALLAIQVAKATKRWQDGYCNLQACLGHVKELQNAHKTVLAELVANNEVKPC